MELIGISAGFFAIAVAAYLLGRSGPIGRTDRPGGTSQSPQLAMANLRDEFAGFRSFVEDELEKLDHRIERIRGRYRRLTVEPEETPPIQAMDRRSEIGSLREKARAQGLLGGAGHVVLSKGREPDTRDGRSE